MIATAAVSDQYILCGNLHLANPFIYMCIKRTCHIIKCLPDCKTTSDWYQFTVGSYIRPPSECWDWNDIKWHIQLRSGNVKMIYLTSNGQHHFHNGIPLPRGQNYIRLISIQHHLLYWANIEMPISNCIKTAYLCWLFWYRSRYLSAIELLMSFQ